MFAAEREGRNVSQPNSEQDWENASAMDSEGHRKTNGSGRHWQAPNPNYRSPKLKTIDPINLEGKTIPPRRWIVPDWVPVGVTTLLYGDGGLGKSLLAMQLATACATSQKL